MAASYVNKRIITEVTRLQALGTGGDASGVKFILDKSPIDDASISVILGRILPNSNIYNQAAFQIEIKPPAEYPFVAPQVRFVTPIYHPNVDDQGTISLDILGPVYSPKIPLTDVVKEIVNLIDNPDLDNTLRPEIAAEYTTNRAEFDKRALEMVRKHGLPRS